MSKQELLLIEAMFEPIEARLVANYDVHRAYAARDPGALLAEVGPRIRAVVTGGGSGLSRAIAEKLPALEIVAINGIGTDAVDLDEMRRRGVHVTTTPGVLTEDVADLAMGLMIATLRGLVVGDRHVRTGQWPSAGLSLAHKVSGRRLGIIGLGRIGRAIARRAEAFGMSIAYTDIKAFDDVPYRYEADLVTLAAASDVLVVAAAATASSRGLVNASVLDALGAEGTLINVARGAIVDEPALVQALREGRLGAAGLDVFADEPRVPQELWAMDNVVLQPHRASATVETRLAMGELVLDNLAAHFAGRPLLTAVV